MADRLTPPELTESGGERTFDSFLERVAAAPAVSPPAAVATPVTAGTIVGGRFRAGDVIGFGGMAVVQHAHDLEYDQAVALKLHAEPADARLLREARALTSLSDPHVVKVLDVGEHEGRTYIAMEFAPGGTARGFLAAGPGPARVLQLFGQAARGLAVLHAAGLVHRDFKPENVLIMQASPLRAVVTDLGLVRASDDVESPEAFGTQLTRQGIAMGTPGYMAPEQCEGRAVTAASDQFALCVSVWEALFGARPFPATTVQEFVFAAARGAPVLAAHARRVVPDRAVRALRKGLAFDPADRHADIRALLLELAARDRTPAVVAGVAAVVLALGAAGATAAWWPAQSQRICDTEALDGAAPNPAVAGVAKRWQQVAEQACHDPRRATSRCLDRVRDQLAETAAASLHGEAALAVAEAIPDPDLCMRQDPPYGSEERQAHRALARARAQRASGELRAALESLAAHPVTEGTALHTQITALTGAVRSDLGQHDRAIDTLNDALERAATTGIPDPASTARELARAHLAAANADIDPDGAREKLEGALQRLRSHLPDHAPSMLDLHRACRVRCASVFQPNHACVVRHLSAILDAADPQDPTYHRLLLDLGRAQQGASRHADAKATLQRALKLTEERLGTTHPDADEIRHLLRAFEAGRPPD